MIDEEYVLVKKTDLKIVLDEAAKSTTWGRTEWLAFNRLNKSVKENNND